MASDQELENQATDLAFSLLREAGFENPPFNPYSVAARQKIQVIELDTMGEKSSRLVPGRPPVIEVNAKHPPVRRCFWLAYSLMNYLLPLPELDEARRHKIWMTGATELMMPEEWFREIGELTDWDLYQLHHEFAFSSHEAIARRTAALTQAFVTIFDNGAVSRRFASPGLDANEELSPDELRLYAEAAKNGPGSYELQSLKGWIRAYHIRPYRSRWQRIILLRTPPDAAREF